MRCKLILDCRGAAVSEYALLLFAVLLVGAGALRRMGPQVAEAGIYTKRVLSGEDVTLADRSGKAQSSDSADTKSSASNFSALGSSYATDSLSASAGSQSGSGASSESSKNSTSASTAGSSGNARASLASVMAFGGGVVLGASGAPSADEDKSGENKADSTSASAKPSAGSTSSTPHFTAALFNNPDFKPAAAVSSSSENASRANTGSSASHATSGSGSKSSIVAKSTPTKSQGSVSTGSYTISAAGEAQMCALLTEAKSKADGDPPEGRCYASVATYIDAVGYGKMGKAPGASLPSVPDAYGTYAHQFADYMNAKGADGQTNASRLGLQRLPITNPYKAPPGSIVVVRAGTPGTANPVAGDIVVVGKNGAFYNDGNMGYGGSQNFPAGNSYVLGVYAAEMSRVKNVLGASVATLTFLVATQITACGSSTSGPNEGASPGLMTQSDAATEGGSAAYQDAAVTTTAPLPFLVGTAIAGFQVDMGCPTIDAATCEDRNSDWYQWITTPRIQNNPVLYQSKDPPSYGPGFYELYENDLDLAAHDLSNNALRLSIEYSRIFPTSTVGVAGYGSLRSIASADGIAYYHRIFAAMKARGLQPLVTINHYSLPLWLHDGNACNEDIDTCTAKGWAAPDVIVPEIAKYAGFVAQEFGGEVDLWATENEPFSAVVLPSYLIPSSTRVSPPGLYLHTATAKAAALAMIEAHARMYDAVHANDTIDADGDGKPASVGLVYSVVAVSPLTSDESDAKAAVNARYFMNDMFLQGVAKGIVDPNWDGSTEVRSDLANRLDWLGVNYYARIKAQANVVPTPLDGVSPYLTFNLLNLQSDLDDPSGIYDALEDQKKWGVPMIVTETGIDQATDPSLGASWIAKTMQYVQRVKAEGVPVGGYFAWSLMDNYEWNHGTSMRFGIYAVDPTTTAKTRVPRSAAAVLTAIAENGGAVPAALAATYAIP